MKEFFQTLFNDTESQGTSRIAEFTATLYDRWKNDVEGLTMFVMAINHQSWEHYSRGNSDWCDFYAELYYKYYEKAINYLEKTNSDGLTYFIRTLD